MAEILFYEKPGCANNARQKQLLKAAGHTVITRNLLTEAWTAERLRSFFGGLPEREWFNRAAPRVKSGEIVPEQLAADAALSLMLAEPLLIRRPLLECAGRASPVSTQRASRHGWAHRWNSKRTAICKPAVVIRPRRHARTRIIPLSPGG